MMIPLASSPMRGRCHAISSSEAPRLSRGELLRLLAQIQSWEGGTRGPLRMMHGGGCALSCCAFAHRVAFEEAREQSPALP